jgi:hypothetical protein
MVETISRPRGLRRVNQLAFEPRAGDTVALLAFGLAARTSTDTRFQITLPVQQTQSIPVAPYLALIVICSKSE